MKATQAFQTSVIIYESLKSIKTWFYSITAVRTFKILYYYRVSQGSVTGPYPERDVSSPEI